MTGGRSPPLARGSQHDRAVDELELELSPLLQAEFQAKGGRQGEPAVVVQLQGRHQILSGSLQEPQAASRRIGRPGGLVTSPVRCPSMWCTSGSSLVAIDRRDATAPTRLSRQALDLLRQAYRNLWNNPTGTRNRAPYTCSVWVHPCGTVPSTTAWPE